MNEAYLDICEKIHVPEKLNKRVLKAASESENHVKVRHNVGIPLRVAACFAVLLIFAAAALTLNNNILTPQTLDSPDSVAQSDDIAQPDGVVASQSEELPLDDTVGDTGTVLTDSETHAFTLLSCAENGSVLSSESEDGKLAISVGSGASNPEFGCYTGSLFSISGENIAEVSLSIDRGGFYKQTTIGGISHEDLKDYYSSEDYVKYGATDDVHSYDEEEFFINRKELLGSDVTMSYESGTMIGLWISPEEMPETDEDADMADRLSKEVDVLDGAIMTVKVTLTDGTESSARYILNTGRLIAEYSEDDGKMIVYPIIAKEDEPYLYGVYFTLINEV